MTQRKFKVGDRVVNHTQANDHYRPSEWTGTVIEIHHYGVYYIRADEGSDWQDLEESLILEQLYNSPLLKALE